MAEDKCLECGWEGQWSKVGHKTVLEDCGDVSCLVRQFRNRGDLAGGKTAMRKVFARCVDFVGVRCGVEMKYKRR